jgi:hypothetical protein
MVSVFHRQGDSTRNLVLCYVSLRKLLLHDGAFARGLNLVAGIEQLLAQLVGASVILIGARLVDGTAHF